MIVLCGAVIVFAKVRFVLIIARGCSCVSEMCMLFLMCCFGSVARECCFLDQCCVDISNVHCV